MFGVDEGRRRDSVEQVVLIITYRLTVVRCSTQTMDN